AYEVYILRAVSGDEYGVAVQDRSFFFFSSRRRHTRLVSDWSSDVCSSDLLNSSPQSSYSAVGMTRHAASLRTRLNSSAFSMTFRSEERRVGKEGRSRWAP